MARTGEQIRDAATEYMLANISGQNYTNLTGPNPQLAYHAQREREDLENMYFLSLEPEELQVILEWLDGAITKTEDAISTINQDTLNHAGQADIKRANDAQIAGQRGVIEKLKLSIKVLLASGEIPRNDGENLESWLKRIYQGVSVDKDAIEQSLGPQDTGESFEYQRELDRQARADYEERRTQQQIQAVFEATQNSNVVAARAAESNAAAIAELARTQEQQAQILTELSDASKRILAAAERAKEDRIESELESNRAKLEELIKREQERAGEKMQDILDPRRVAERQRELLEEANKKAAELIDSLKKRAERGPLTPQDIEDLKDAELGKYDQAIRDKLAEDEGKETTETPLGSLESIFGKPLELSEKTIKEIRAAYSAAKIWTREEIETQKEIYDRIRTEPIARYLELMQKIRAGEMPLTEALQ